MLAFSIKAHTFAPALKMSEVLSNRQMNPKREIFYFEKKSFVELKKDLEDKKKGYTFAAAFRGKDEREDCEIDWKRERRPQKSGKDKVL